MHHALWTVVSPSPKDLFEALPDEEKIAIDLFLTEPDGLSEDTRHLLARLVPSARRHGYLQTLARQLAALGISVHQSEELDARLEVWRLQRERYAAEVAQNRRLAQEREKNEQARLTGLPTEVRRALARHERRRRRRRRRR